MKRVITMLIPLAFTACSNNFMEINEQDESNKRYTSQEQIKELNRNYKAELIKYDISELNLNLENSLNINHQTELINIFKNSNLFNIRKEEISKKLNEFESTKKLHLNNLSNKELNLLIKQIERLNNKNNYVTNVTYREFNNMIEMDKSLLIDNYIIDLTISKQ